MANSTLSRAVAAAVLGVSAAAAARRLTRFEIAEESMAPALAAGDWVIAVRRPLSVRPGDVVVYEHPELSAFFLVKRVTEVSSDTVVVAGDNLSVSASDSRELGPLPIGAIEARVVWRYWPPGRVGKVPLASPA